MQIGALTRFVLAHKRLVVACWVVITLVGIASISKATGALSQEFNLPGREGSETSKAILTTYGNGGQQPPLVLVVTLPANGKIDDPKVKTKLQNFFDKIQAAAPHSRIASYLTTGDRAFVAKDGRTTFGFVFTPAGRGFADSPEVGAVRLAVDALKRDPDVHATLGDQIHLSGYNELATGGGGGDGASLLAETLIGGGGALVVLAFVFGSFLALVPLLMAAIAIVTTFLVIWGVTTVADVSFIVQFLVALIGLGVAIDYALLIVTRWREEREAGLDNEAAVQRAMETAGSSVVFSGTTVGIGLFALVVLPVPALRSIGYGGMLIPVISVIVATTLLPVMLATVGPRLDWPRLRRGDQTSQAWLAWARLVVRRRWIAAALAVALLAILIIPAFSLSVGDPRADSLAKGGEAHDGLVALEQSGIGSGVLLPFEVLVKGTDPAAAAAALGKLQDVRGAIAPDGAAWRRADSALVAVLPAVDGNSTAGRDTLDRVRSGAHALPGTVRVGGPAAENADFVAAVYGNFPLMVALIGVVTFVLLVRAFRSIVLPLKALVLNGLSVGAAFGILVFVWQQGHGSHLIWGVTPTGSITAFVPLMVFAFLFGLSMDYEVFILARMREEYDAHGDTDGAVVRGIGLTGRLVTSAALILFLAFAALGSGPEVTIKVFATGLAAGILLDATVIRALLVPALVSVMGQLNWWLPAGLERFVPHSAAGRAAPSVGAEAD